MHNLDELSLINDIDSAGMGRALAGFPEQCREAEALAAAVDLKALGLPGAAGGISAVVTLGMGGSGIGGDVVRTLVESELTVPFLVNKSYELPGFVDASTLVVAVSFSGETEETLAAFESAVTAGAQILVMTGGGRLLERALELDLPLLKVPTGLQPRAALGYLALPQLMLLRRLGLIDSANRDVEEAINQLDLLSAAYASAVPTTENAAKKLALELKDLIPVIYGSDGLTAAAALRWKCQFNENSKTPAFWNVFSELNHNEIVGWDETARPARTCRLIVLRDSGENARVQKRIGITVEMVRANVAGVTEIRSSGESPLARLLSLTYLGDYASYYLALLNGIDPTPVESIRQLKERLNQNN